MMYSNDNSNKRDRIEINGVVVESANSKFKVKINDNHFVLATLSGKIRKNSVKILVGDSVIVEVSPYDLNMGRIVYRVKTNT